MPRDVTGKRNEVESPQRVATPGIALPHLNHQLPPPHRTHRHGVARRVRCERVNRRQRFAPRQTPRAAQGARPSRPSITWAPTSACAPRWAWHQPAPRMTQPLARWPVEQVSGRCGQPGQTGPLASWAACAAGQDGVPSSTQTGGQTDNARLQEAPA